jgi:hypothetical protein
MMSVINDPRVTPVHRGWRVENPDVGHVRVYPNPMGGWACFFDSSTPTDLRPAYGFHGSASDTAEEAVEFALRVEKARA